MNLNENSMESRSKIKYTEAVLKWSYLHVLFNQEIKINQITIYETFHAYANRNGLRFSVFNDKELKRFYRLHEFAYLWQVQLEELNSTIH